MTGRSWAIGCALTLGVALAALLPTLGDPGLTYDEPAYRYSQVMSAQWWARLGSARSWADLKPLLTPEALLYYWPYGRFGINFHPPLAGQLNLLTHALTGGFLQDIAARRLASAVEFALAVTLLFGFLARRSGPWAGGIAAGSLLFQPRVFGQAHLIDTDTPGLLLWAATACAFWKGLHDEKARRWRVAVGVLVGLAFVEKLGAVMVVLPLLAWLGAARLPRALGRGTRPAWIDGLATSALMLAPLALAYVEIRRLAAEFLRMQVRMGIPVAKATPAATDLFRDHPTTAVPGWVLAVPLGVWLARRLLARLAPRSPIWGVERPGLETWAAILAFGPAVAWLGNPEWWRETLPRLAHYYAICTARRGVLPDIQVLYFGQIYEYSLPWPNGWVLIGITVPASILAAALVGLAWAVARGRRDRLPLNFGLHLAILPALRMLPTPAHDGVRLLLPSFFFLAALAGWGAAAAGEGFARLVRRSVTGPRAVVALLVVAPAVWATARVHPFELSYYNELIGGPRGAWAKGFELSYWYDAFTPAVVADLNRALPEGARVGFPNTLSSPTTFDELQTLGHLRPDIRLGGRDEPFRFAYLWLLTHDSKAMAFTRLLFAMEPTFFAVRPPQLDGLRVATVATPEAASRALALQLLTDAPDRSPPEPPVAPGWVRRFAPPLARLWGDGLTKVRRLTVNEPIFAWARRDPAGFRAAAQFLADWPRDRPESFRAALDALAAGRAEAQDPRRRAAFPAAVNQVATGPPLGDHPDAAELFRQLTRYDDQSPFAADLLTARPAALVEAATILADRGDAVRRVLQRYGFTDPETVGGPLDRGLVAPHRIAGPGR